MSNKKKIIIFTAIILIEIISGLFLLKIIKGRKIKNIPVAQINTDNIDYSASEKLKYFYKYAPNTYSTMSADFVKEPITNKTNNDGLNDLDNYPTEKSINTFRMIALGDSFTYGSFVNTKDNWVEVLEKKLNEKKICKNIDKFEVINLGVFGYDPRYEIEMYSQVGQKYNPDLIIWMLIEKERINEEKVPYVLSCMKENKKSEHQCYLDAIDETKKKGNDYIVSKQKEAFSIFRKMSDKHIYFIDFYGTHQEVINDISNSSVLNNINDLLLDKYPKEKIKFPDTHPNEFGHQLIANMIFEQLFQTNQIPCEPQN